LGGYAKFIGKGNPLHSWTLGSVGRVRACKKNEFPSCGVTCGFLSGSSSFNRW
jgi:hypothetical protein